MRTPRQQSPGRERPLPFPRYVDADSLTSPAEDDGERVVWDQHVLPSPRRSDRGAPRKQCGSPRSATATAEFLSTSGSSVGCTPPSPFSKRRHVASPRATPFSKMVPLSLLPQRAPSPVGELPVDAVMSPVTLLSPRLPLGVTAIRSPRRAILGSSDVEKITHWLRSLSHESRGFSSYALYCETLFHESSVLTQGKPVTNRLQTAIAFHCLCKASGVFARHESILRRICSDLGAAIYLNHKGPLILDEEINALEFFARRTTYYEHATLLELQKQDLRQEMKQQKATYLRRLEGEKAQIEQLKDLERHLQVNTLGQINHRKTRTQDLSGKLHHVLHHFQHVSEGEKDQILLGTVESLRAQVSADALVAIIEQMDLSERDKLLEGLFQNEIKDITERIEAQLLMHSNANQNTILERSVLRITRFQTLLSQCLKGPAEEGEQKEAPNLAADDCLCDPDRKLLENVGDMVDELEREKKKIAELEQKLQEAEKLATDLRWKNNTLINEADEAALKHAQQLQEMQKKLEAAHPSKEDKETQVGQRHGKSGGAFDLNDDDDEGRTSSSSGTRKRRLATPVNAEDDELILKNRAKNKFGYGIANIIDQARIAPSKVRKILSKRKPLTLNELHGVIIGYYQAKMFQDVQDDSSGKPRANLAQFIMEMYVLHYGLKDLAISQLIFLDASIRRNARESARVRTFGLLTGSLDPESHACSVQGVDFFLLMVVIIFNAGVYKKGRKQAVAVAQNLKTFFGDGVFMGPKAVTVKKELVYQTIDLAFSFTRNESGGPLDQLKDEISQRCATTGGELDIDLVMEKIMNYWFVLYEHQIQDIHAMFTMVDTNGDGTLDFQEFCDMVVVLEPNMDRRDALALYNRAAGEDNVIDKDEFVQVMLAHQRGVILEEFYGGYSNKKILMGIEQRKNTMAPLGAAPEAQSDKLDESYESLTAAMASLAQVSQDASDDDEGADSQRYTSKSESENVQENVSFQTLSRLSTWAAMAKVKLQSTRYEVVKTGGRAARASHDKPITIDSVSARISGGPLVAVDGKNFEEDVDELLRQALSKVKLGPEGSDQPT